MNNLRPEQIKCYYIRHHKDIHSLEQIVNDTIMAGHSIPVGGLVIGNLKKDGLEATYFYQAMVELYDEI